MHRCRCYFQEMVAIGSRGWIDMTRCYRCRDWAEWTCPFSLHATSNLCLVIGNQSSVVQVHLEGLRWLADGDRCLHAILNIVQLRSVREFDTTCPWVKSNVCSFCVVTDLFARANCDGVWSRSSHMRAQPRSMRTLSRHAIEEHRHMPSHYPEPDWQTFCAQPYCAGANNSVSVSHQHMSNIQNIITLTVFDFENFYISKYAQHFLD